MIETLLALTDTIIASVFLAALVGPFAAVVYLEFRR